MISFLTNSNLTYELYRGRKDNPKFCGGNYYEIEAINTLESSYKLKFENLALRKKNESIFKYFRRLSQFRTSGSIVIKSPMAIAFSKNNKNIVNIGIIHHIDKPTSLKNLIYNQLIIKKSRDLDYIVTVSEYWKKKLNSYGCHNVRVIHNSYDVNTYNIKQSEAMEVLKKYKIPTDKPIIYIGNALKEKGAIQVYNALKNQNYTLIMTGNSNQLDIPVRCIYFDEKDYRKFLKATDLVITMSLMNEGWNRIAHEAMLVGTPVIGNGSGGMSDLLVNGDQTIIRNHDLLSPEVKRVLKNKDIIGKNGKEYVKRFDLNYFNENWLNLIKDIKNKII